MSQMPCPDGYLIESQDPLRYAHEQINLWLVEQEEWDASHSHLQIENHKALKKQFRPQQLVEFLQASIVRAEFHAAEGRASAASGHSARIHGILLSLSRLPLVLTEDQLTWLLEFAIRRGQYLWPRDEVCEHIEAAKRRGGFNAATWQRLHRLHEGMSGDTSITAQTVRRRLALLLWHDPYDAIDLKKCWSEAIRSDLRALPEEQRKRWNAALECTPVSDSTEPPNAWKKQADSHVLAIGADPFREKLVHWFAAFQGAEAVRLTMGGSHILKALLWYSRLLRDPQMDAGVLSLLHTKWRNKEFVFRPLTVLAGNVALFPPEEAWPLLVRIQEILGAKASARLDKVIEQVGAQRGLSAADLRRDGLLRPEPDPMAGLDKMMKVLQSNPAWARFRYDGEYIEIDGGRDRYRAHVPSCTIERVRDHARVELDRARVPERWRPLFSSGASAFQCFTKLAFLLSMNEDYDFLIFRETT